MAIENLYPKGPEKDDEQRRHKPEIIITDEEYDEAHKEPDLTAMRVRGSLLLRFFMLLLCGIAILTLTFNLLVFAAHSVLNVATLLRSPVFITVWRKTLRAVKRWAVIAVGSFLAILLPGIGITFMLSYFLVSADTERQKLFMHLFRNYVDRGNGGEDQGPHWS